MMKKIQIFLVGLMLFMPCSVLGQNFLYGDVNGDGEVDISDVNAVIGVIMGDQYHNKSIVGCWVSEYALDDNGERFDIPDPIKVSFDFYGNQSGRWGCYTDYNNGIIDYVGLKWEQQVKRLYLWFDDGDHEELYYGFNEEGYLLLSLNSQMTQYTAYRPVTDGNPFGASKESRHSDSPAATKSVSRAVGVIK